jgi:hypothetical protein
VDAMKTLVLFLIATVGFAADLTGTWACSVETDMGSGNPTFTLKQEGSKITGKYEGTLGSADVVGKISGSEFEYSFAFDQGSVVYKGNFEGNRIKGDVDLAGQAKGKFSCDKK